MKKIKSIKNKKNTRIDSPGMIRVEELVIIALELLIVPIIS